MRKCSWDGKGVEEWHPLKQGLKQQRCLPIGNWKAVEEWHPLKQGLKLVCNIRIHRMWILVEEWHPLKQGLKQVNTEDKCDAMELKSDIH